MGTALEEVSRIVEHCNRCGFCQAGCPVYKVTGIEWGVARGRLALIRNILEGNLELDDTLREPVFNCLMCNGCTSQCPPGIETDKVIAAAREEIARIKGLGWVQKLVFRELLPNPGRLNAAVQAARFSQAPGVSTVSRWVQGSGVMGQLGQAQDVLPAIPGRTARKALNRGGHLRALESPKYRVAYFLGCGVNNLYPDVAEALARVLRLHKTEMVLPDLVCCGKPAHVYGDRQATEALARANIDALHGLDVDAIVTDCATCGSFIMEYPHLLEHDQEYGEKARQVAAKMKDVSVFLTEIGPVEEMSPVNVSVTYHDPCHLGRFQKATAQPRNLLKRIPGLEFKEAAEADMCCGGAGSYSLTHFDISTRILDRKMGNFARTGAQVLATGCPGCSIQLSYGIRRNKLPMRMMHTVELLDQAYSSTPRGR